MMAALLACIAVLVYAFSSPGNHAPNLHGAASVAVVGDHSHDQGDYSRDDLDATSDDIGESDHHHADHTHEKAGLAQGAGPVLRNSRSADYLTRASSLLTGPPYGIDRPPRIVTLL